MAARLIPDSKFLLVIHEDSSCNISLQEATAELIKRAKLIVWDEAPMTHRHIFEAVNRTFQDIMKTDKPFGGKVIVFGGDFRQILPVIKHGSRFDIVQSSSKNSILWENIQVMKLTTNMRLQNSSENSGFSEYILAVGEGQNTLQDDTIELPPEICFNGTNLDDFISEMYPTSLLTCDNLDVSGRTILTSKNDTVNNINSKVIKYFRGSSQIYLSSDSVCDPVPRNLYPIEYLNSLNISGLPPHRLELKKSSPIMLIRNLDPSKGLCNGTQLICTEFRPYVLQAQIVTEVVHQGEHVLIPRIIMKPSDTELPFDLKRRQFPIRSSFAMTINKSQGQTLNKVGVYLPDPVFTHGQLYVALSRVKSKRDIKFYFENSDPLLFNVTKNIVYKEIFN